MKPVDLSVRQRLIIGFGALLVLLALELAVTSSWLHRLGDLRTRLSDDIGPRAKAAGRLERAVLYRAVSLRNYGLTHDARYLGAQAGAFEEVRAALHDLDALAYLPEGRAIVNEMKPAAEAYAGAADAFLDLLLGGAGEGDLEPAERELTAAREKLFHLARRFSDFQQKRLEATTAGIEAAQRTMAWGLPFLAILMLATILATGFLVSRAVADPVGELLKAARALAQGEYGPALALASGASASKPASHGLRNELRELAGAVAHAAGMLQRREARLEADARLSSALASSLAVEKLADDALRAIASHVGAELGAVYVLEDASSTMRRVAGFAFEGGAPALGVGEGIPGQAVAQKSTLHVRDIPADAPFRVRLGFDEAPPRAALAVPLLHADGPRGVILLAGLREFTEDDVRFAEHGAILLGTSLENALAHRDLDRTRSALQERNELLNARNTELQDQREQIQAQNEELQAQNEEIQAQNEELQAQRDQLQDQGEQLRETARALEEADRRKDEFLATLGHELRNPLAAIDFAVEVLEKRSPTAVSGQVAVISRQTRQLARLMDDLLDVSRIAHGKLRLQKRPIEMGQILQQAAESSRAFIDARRHDLSLRIDDGTLAVDGDPARLEQIVCNLLHNAAKFTEPGGSITAAVQGNSDRVVLRVKDTGIGIDRDLLPRVFDLFTQGAQPSASRREGLGVGLNLVRGLVEMHGGHVEALSDGPQRGSEFVVSLPRIAPAPAENPGKAGPSPEDARCPRPLRVLVVDDNADVAGSLADLLEEWGHHAQIERDGRQALEAAVQSRPDVVLLDIGLPDMSGYEVARELRARLGPFSRAKLIALTGHGQDEDRKRARDAGFDLHLVKAVATQELRRVLAEFARALPGAETV